LGNIQNAEREEEKNWNFCMLDLNLALKND
jgi:hypothetical protein